MKSYCVRLRRSRSAATSTRVRLSLTCNRLLRPAIRRSRVPLRVDAKPQDDKETATASLAQQELAGRMLLTRRQLMERVEKSLRPLFRGQMLQVLIGVALIAARSAVLGSKYADSASRCERSHFARVRRDRDISSVARLHENPKNRLLEIRCRHSQQTRQPAIRLPACRCHHRIYLVADVDSRCRCLWLRRRATSETL